MEVEEVASKLWTPEGMVNLQKDVIPITRSELVHLSWLHEFSQRHGLSLVCKKCDSGITGQNNDINPNPSVQCRCREFRFFAK